MPEPDDFMTVPEVATILKLNQQTVRNWIDAGTLPAIRIGRRVRIKREHLGRLIEEGYRPRRSTFGSSVSEGIWDGDIAPPDVP